MITVFGYYLGVLGILNDAFWVPLGSPFDLESRVGKVSYGHYKRACRGY